MKNRISTMLLAGALLAGCGDDHKQSASASPTAALAASSTTAAQPTATAQPADAAVYRGFAGTAQAGDGTKWKCDLLLEQRGGAAVARFTLWGGATLEGRIDDKSAFVLEGGGFTLEGSVDAQGRVQAKGSGPHEKKLTLDLEALAGVGQAASGELRDYRGVLGKNTLLRAQLTLASGKLTGKYRYAKSTTDLTLEGTVSPSGVLSLVETNAGKVTGRIQGVMDSGSVIAGRWTSADGAKNHYLAFTVDPGSYPKMVEIPGGGRIAPQEEDKDVAKDCGASILYPKLVGLKEKKAEEALNQAFRAAAIAVIPDEKSCKDAIPGWGLWGTAAYKVHLARPGVLSIEQSAITQAFKGAEYGTTTCGAVDLTKGTIESPLKLLSPDARKKLDALVSKQLGKELALKDPSRVCVKEGKTWVQPTNDEGSALTEAPVELPNADLLPLFRGNAVMEALLK